MVFPRRAGPALVIAPAMAWTRAAFGQGMAIVRRAAGEVAQVVGRAVPHIRFRDVAGQAVLDFHHSPGGRLNKQYIVEVTGSGAALIDFENDGLQDVLLVNQPGWGREAETTPSRLYRNLAGLRFEDWTE